MGAATLEVRELLDLAVLALRAVEMGLPEDLGIAGLRLPRHDAERSVESPRVDADDLHSTLDEPARRIRAQPRVALLVAAFLEVYRRARPDEHDIKWLDGVADARELVRDIRGGNAVTGRFGAHVEPDAITVEPAQRELVDGLSWRAARRGAVVVRRVDVRAAMRGEGDTLDGPGVPWREVFRLEAVACDHRQRLGVADVRDTVRVWLEVAGRVGDAVAQVDEGDLSFSELPCLPCPSMRHLLNTVSG